MRVIRDNPGRKLLSSSVVTIGNFDGLHRGHQSLVDRCKSLADGNRPVAVVTFEPLPQAWFRPDLAPARLTSVSQKLGILAGHGVDLVWMMRFNKTLAAMTAQDFVASVLVDVLAASDVVVGEDFHYGKHRQGDTASLVTAGEHYGFGVDIAPTLLMDGGRVSSTRIREHLASGRLDKASEMLGRPFTLSGRVVRGNQLGRKLGYPTANLGQVSAPCPLKGVFAVRARWRGQAWRDGVANLGTRPAVGGTEFKVEVHLFDFDGDLYGRRMEIAFVEKLRDEANFADIDDLVKQMRDDEHRARQCLAWPGSVHSD